MELRFSPIPALARGDVHTFAVECATDTARNVFLTLEGFEDAACVSCQCVDYLGKPFQKAAAVSPEAPFRLWCYIRVAKDATVRDYEGQAVLRDADSGEILLTKIVRYSVSADAPVEDPFLDASKPSRVCWLNSTTAIDGSVPAPFLPVCRNGNTVSLLGRSITLDELGMPSAICSYFSKSIQITEKATDVLSAPMHWELDGGTFENRSLEFSDSDELVSVIARNENDAFFMDVEAKIEFDGFVGYRITLEAKKDLPLEDMALTVPVEKNCTELFMGLGKKGGSFDRSLDWKWDPTYDQDCFWTGAVNAGLHVRLYGENYVKPPVNIYYNQNPLRIPESWGNEGLGGIRFDEASSCFRLYTGARTVKKGERLLFGMNLILTPLKEIDLGKHFGMRIFHRPPAKPIHFEERKGANIVNIHHGNDLNPFINYPFIETEALRDFVNMAHKQNVLVKPYYTIRELTIEIPEFQAFRDQGYELYEKNNHPEQNHLWQSESKKWLVEHVGGDVIPAWRQQLTGEKYKEFFDASILTNGRSRLCNFYVEGLNYMVEKVGIDGIYIDDLAYDRNTMKRVRRVIDKRPEAYIDFHTWNHFNSDAAMANCLTLYTELLPYIDKLWIGEGFHNYNYPADFWLVEISGIPFGLMSEMMMEGNRWRGLVFGMTCRLGWAHDDSYYPDPTPVWEIFDRFDLGNTEMLGFWNEESPLRLSTNDALATVWRGKDRSFIAIANMTDAPLPVDLSWNGRTNVRFTAPSVEGFQEGGEFVGSVTLPAAQGYFLIVNE